MRWLLLVGIVLTISTITGITRSLINHQRNQRQILFEVWQFHGGLGPPGERGTWGIYIDAIGDVYYFNATQQKDDTFLEKIHHLIRSDGRGKPPYTTSQLFKHYRDTSEYITTIPENELGEKIALLEESQYGKMEYCNSHSHDWGLIWFDGFIFDPKWKTHERIIIRYWGDSCGYNSSPEAQALFDWLTPLYKEIMAKQGNVLGLIFTPPNIHLQSGDLPATCMRRDQVAISNAKYCSLNILAFT